MQNITFIYKSPNSTHSLNEHIALLLAPGPYNGLEIVPHDPVSMSVGLTAGYALTDEGVKVEQTLPITSLLTFAAADPNYPRIDLVILRHRYAPSENPNPAVYVVVKGIPAPPPATAVAREEIMAPSDPDYLVGRHAGDIILADVSIGAGHTAIHEDDIFNRFRVPTTPELRDQIAEALWLSQGNFVYEGWDLTSDMLNVMVSPGRGLLCGLPERTTHEFIVTTLRAREYLYGPLQSTFHTGQPDLPYDVGANLTLDRQPDYPSKLRITITTGESATSGNVYITGRDEFDEEINNLPVAVSCGAHSSVTVETSGRFKEVYHEGVDAHELMREGATVTIYIKDKPIGYIYAVGTQSSRAVFKSVYDPSYQPLCNELLLGWAETDETEVIELVRWATTALAPVREVLNSQCDGSRKIFTLNSIPRPGTLKVVLDGSWLLENSPNSKGYTLTGLVLTLQTNVTAPDSTATPHGETGADFWCEYIRQS